MIDETIKQLTDKLYQTTLTSDIGTINSEITQSMGTSKSRIIIRVSDSWTPEVSDSTRQDSTTACQ